MHLQWGHWFTKLFQSRGHERGICIPTSCSLRGHSWIQRALCEPLPWDRLAPAVNSPSCFTQAGSLLPTTFGLPHGPYGEWGMLGYPHSLTFCPSAMSAQPGEGEWLCLPSFLLLEGAFRSVAAAWQVPAAVPMAIGWLRVFKG